MSDPNLRRSEIGLGLSEDVDLLRFQERGGLFEAPPEAEALTPGEWIKANLFSSWSNTVWTLVAGAFVAFALYQIGRFIFVAGDWEIVRASLKGYMVGGFPEEELWRVWTIAYGIAVLAGLSWGSMRAAIVVTRRRAIVAALIVAAFVAFLLFAVKTTLVLMLVAGLVVAFIGSVVAGRVLGAARLRRPLIVAWILAFPAAIIIVRWIGDGVPPREWEGFFFNIIAATVSIFASFPIGIMLALGRRSPLPALRLVTVVFIEIFRGVPLVAWLIFSKFVVDLLLPPQMNLPDIIKALIAMTLFSAAYVAEIVRGGLQGVQFGQYEAARALGLSTPRMMGLIILPQALRSTIPAMISHFISLFKDTSLFVAIEVSDLLAIARRSANSPRFLGNDMEALLFAGLVFWIVAFSMARWSQRLELRLGVGER